MPDLWSVIDTGLRPAAQNVALDRALLEARRAEEIPSTLRFLRFTRCALLGSDRSAAQELDVDYCGAAGITVQRRVTGGDPMHLDERQIAWALYLHRRDTGTDDLRAVARRLCHAAATGVSALGVDARYRSWGEIEVDGRRIAASAGLVDGDALLLQGLLLVDGDAGALQLASRFAGRVLAGGGYGAAGDRVASLAEILGAAPDAAAIKRYLVEAFESEFSVEFGEGDLTLSGQARYREALREIEHPDWINLVAAPAAEIALVEGEHRVAGGRLRAAVAFDGRARAIRQVWFGGDIAANPKRTVADLESALKGAPLDRLESRVRAFFASRAVSMERIVPADFATAVRAAVRQLSLDPA